MPRLRPTPSEIAAVTALPYPWRNFVVLAGLVGQAEENAKFE